MSWFCPSACSSRTAVFVLPWGIPCSPHSPCLPVRRTHLLGESHPYTNLSILGASRQSGVKYSSRKRLLGFASSEHPSKSSYVNTSSCTTSSWRLIPHPFLCTSNSPGTQLCVLCRNSSAGDNSGFIPQTKHTQGNGKGHCCSPIPCQNGFFLTNINTLRSPLRSSNAPQLSGIYSEHSLLLVKEKAGRDFQCPSQHCSLPQGPKEEKLKAWCWLSQGSPELFPGHTRAVFQELSSSQGFTTFTSAGWHFHVLQA